MPLPILIAMPIPLADADAEGVLQYAESKLSSLLIDVSGVVDADDAHPPRWLELAARLSPEVSFLHASDPGMHGPGTGSVLQYP
jgi:hypothetical protein